MSVQRRHKPTVFKGLKLDQGFLAKAPTQEELDTVFFEVNPKFTNLQKVLIPSRRGGFQHGQIIGKEKKENCAFTQEMKGIRPGFVRTLYKVAYVDGSGKTFVKEANGFSIGKLAGKESKGILLVTQANVENVKVEREAELLEKELEGEEIIMVDVFQRKGKVEMDKIIQATKAVRGSELEGISEVIFPVYGKKGFQEGKLTGRIVKECPLKCGRKHNQWEIQCNDNKQMILMTPMIYYNFVAFVKPQPVKKKVKKKVQPRKEREIKGIQLMIDGEGVYQCGDPSLNPVRMLVDVISSLQRQSIECMVYMPIDRMVVDIDHQKGWLQLEREGKLMVIPSIEEDPDYLVRQARSMEVNILSNQRFDHYFYSFHGATERNTVRSWLQDHVCSFQCKNGAILPNPAFSLA